MGLEWLLNRALNFDTECAMCISNEKSSISKYLSSSFSQFNPAQKPKAQKIIIDLSILESGSTVLAFDNSLYSKYILNVGEIMKASLEHNSSAHILFRYFMFLVFHAYGSLCFVIFGDIEDRYDLRLTSQLSDPVR